MTRHAPVPVDRYTLDNRAVLYGLAHDSDGSGVPRPTLRALLLRGLIRRVGWPEDGKWTLTAAGRDALAQVMQDAS